MFAGTKQGGTAVFQGPLAQSKSSLKLAMILTGNFFSGENALFLFGWTAVLKVGGVVSQRLFLPSSRIKSLKKSWVGVVFVLTEPQDPGVPGLNHTTGKICFPSGEKEGKMHLPPAQNVSETDKSNSGAGGVLITICWVERLELGGRMKVVAGLITKKMS